MRPWRSPVSQVVQPFDHTSLTETADPPGAKSAALSRELSDFLIEFSIGVHRYAMYPPGHPSLAPIVDRIVQRLDALFVLRRHLSIGIAARQLIIEGVATSTAHPVLADLAQRLHNHQLGALSLQQGVEAEEISDLLDVIATDHERDDLPLGLREGADFPTWKHARLYKVGYDKLELKGNEGTGVGPMDPATELWLGLAQAALRAEEPLDEAPDVAVLARSIESHKRGDAYDQVIVGYLLQIADELKSGDSGNAAVVRERVSGLMNELDDETLARLVDFGGNPAQRKKFVLDANQGLAVDSVLKVLRAAASSSGQSISTSMTRMLSKMAVHAERGTPAMRAQADAALRQNVEALMEGWDLKDPNPETYTSVLDAMSRSAPILNPSETAEELTGATRLIQMALEIDAFGPTVSKALIDLTKQGEVGLLLEMVGSASEGNKVATQIMWYLTSPGPFCEILENEDVGIGVILGLVSEMGELAADPLLDTLMESESRSVRRRVFDILAELGPFVGPKVIDRLKDGRWYVQRNMVALLQTHTYMLDGLDLSPYLYHEDHRVRQEALPLAIRPGCPLRDEALVSALVDDNERIVRMGLLAIQDAVPEAVLQTLTESVLAERRRSIELRALAAKALGTSSTAVARSALLSVVKAGRTLFGKPRIAQKSALVLAAWRSLIHAWDGHPEVEPVLRVARRSADPEILAAVQSKKGPRP